MARCGFVQQRLPEVRRIAVDKHDFGLSAASDRIAETRGEVQAAGAAADDHDARQARGAVRCKVGRGVVHVGLPL